MFRKKVTALCVAQACTAISLAASAFVVHAQATQRVEVTGSNIRRIDAETASPVQVISSEDLAKSGFSTVSEVLRNIVANGNGTLDQGFAVGFAGGGSGVSLRGLTVGSTLTLIDGKRVAGYPLTDDGQRSFVDISSIPLEAVERIEILKDGASAIYGSDAIAGVVNVIMKKHQKGTTVTAEYGDSQHGGGQSERASITHGFGERSDNSYGIISFEYRNQDVIKLKDREGDGDWSRFNWAPKGGDDLRPGSVNQPYTSIPRIPSNPYWIDTVTDAQQYLSSGCNEAAMAANQCVYKNNWAQIKPKVRNFSLVGSWTTKLGGDWELTSSAQWLKNEASQVRQGRPIPFGTFGGLTAYGPNQAPTIVGASGGYTFGVGVGGNPFPNPAVIRGYIPGAGDGAITEFDTDTYRLAMDLKGSMAGWDLTGSIGWSKVETTSTFKNYITNYPALEAGLQAGTIPLVGPISKSVLNSFSQDIDVDSWTEQKFFEGKATRELMQLEGGGLGLALGIGYQHRELSQPNDALRRQGISEASSSYAFGKDVTKSVYAELVAPVLKNLTLDFALRYDDVDTYGSSTTPKVGFKYTPLKELGIRGTYAEGFRAPYGTENGVAGSTYGLGNYRDPVLCAAPALVPGGSRADNPANFKLACSYPGAYLQTTNANLKPETSESYTFGFILEPIKGWTTTIDYWKIKVDDQVFTEGNLPSYDRWAVAVRGAPQLAERGDGTFAMTPVGFSQYFPVTYLNASTVKTDGIDLETNYKFRLAEYGSLNANLMWTHVFNYDFGFDGATYSLAGTHGPSVISGNTGSPKDRAQLTLTWEKGPWTVATTTNYVSGYDSTDESIGTPDCQSFLNYYGVQYYSAAVYPNSYCKVDAFTFTNLNVRYKFDKQLTLIGSVTNLFDQEPPVDLGSYAGAGGNTSSGNSGAPYNPSLHQAGAIGRYFTVGLRYSF